MENKINVGDQNTQQVGETSASNPVQIPEKPKLNYWMISTMALFILLVVGGGLYLFTTKKQPTSQYTQQSVPSPTTAQTSNSVVPGWKTYTSTEGNYVIQYPSDWVVEVYKEKYPYNTSYDKGHIVFQSRETTIKEKADDAPGLPVDMGTGSIKIITTNSMRGLQYAKISEQDFFNPNNDFWLKGNAGGGGPGTTYSVPEEVSVGGKRAMKQTTHPTTAYEWVGPNQITTNYYVWLGNSANEVVEISFVYDDTNKNKDALIKNFNQMVSTFKLTN